MGDQPELIGWDTDFLMFRTWSTNSGLHMGKENTMENTTATQFNIQEQVTSVVNTVVAVITNPAAFFRGMPRTGGFNDPIIFLAAMGLVSAVLQILLSIFGLGMASSIFSSLLYIIIFPVAYVIGGFIGGGVLFLIWKVMGSREEYETAFRCAAYMAAIGPVTTVLNVIPYLGSVLSTCWWAYLSVMASIEVHELLAKPAWIVFGSIAAILILLSLPAQYKARQFAKEMDALSKKMGKIEEMSPEEAGKKLGEFMKGVQEGSGKK
jgi:hypothetical protein